MNFLEIQTRVTSEDELEVKEDAGSQERWRYPVCSREELEIYFQDLLERCMSSRIRLITNPGPITNNGFWNKNS